MITETPTLLMRALADSVRRIINSPDEGRVSKADLAVLVRYLRFALSEARRAHRAAEAALTRGVEAGEFRRRCNLLLTAVNDALDAASHVRRVADGIQMTKENSVPLLALGAAEDGLGETLAALTSYLAVLDKPRPVVDWASVSEQAAADKAAGRYIRYESYGEILKDLSSGT